MKHLAFLFALLCFVLACKPNSEHVSESSISWGLNRDSTLALVDSLGPGLLEIDFQSKIDPKYLQTDFALLKAALEEASPNLYRYHSETEVEDFFSRQITKMQDSLSYFEYLGLLAESFHFMGCGHSSWSHHPNFYAFRDTAILLFPAKVQIKDGQLFLQENYQTEYRLKPGDRILSINGLADSILLRTLKKRMYQDGEAAAENYQDIARYFPNAYSNFISQDSLFEIEVKAGEHVKTFTLKGLSKAEIAQYQNTDKSPFLELDIRESESIARYKIAWFRNEGIAARGQNFNRYTDSVFNLLAERSIDTLVIDLRQNVGGWTANGAKLLSYFLEEEKSYINQVYFKKISDYSFSSLIAQMPSIEDSMEIQADTMGRLQWLNYPSLKVKPSAKRFEGTLVILIDEWTRSAAGVFCSLARKYTQAIFIGPENASARGGQGGMLMSIRLPYTGIPVYFSTARYEIELETEGDPNHGILSDFPSIEAWQKKYPRSQIFTDLY